MSRFPVGNQFSHLRLNGYVNINDRHRQPDRLHGTETLCGDWNGHTLLLGNDFCGTDHLKAYEELNPGRNPFHHAKIPTNRNLVKFLRPHGINIDIDGTTAKTCDALFANSIWLIKPGSMTAKHPDPELALAVSEPVLRATLENMRKLERVICFGENAYRGICRLFGLNRSFARDRDAFLAGTGKALTVEGLKIHPIYHPSFNPATQGKPPHALAYQRIFS